MTERGMMIQPTEKDRAAHAAIFEWIQKVAWPPTVRDVAELLGVTVSTADARLNRLEDLGWIARERKVARGLKVLKKP